MEKTSGNRVCVVGAGIAGLAAAKVLRDDGFEVLAFEKKANIGGVWAPSRTYPALRTNTTREQYAFSDFPYPESADSFPTAEQVRSYLESYVEHFKLRDLLRLSTEVASISRVPAGSAESNSRFRVVVKPTGFSGEPETLYFDYVAVCNGVFSIPNVPEIDGKERFSGRVIHSSQFTDPALVEGKRVIVVGAGKSALDCATVAARHARSCTLVFREPHWMAPRYIFGVRYDRLFFTRFAEAFHRYYRTGRAEKLLHGPGKPLVQLFWQAQSAFVRRYLQIPDALVPGHPLPGKLEIGVGGNFYEVMREGRAVAKRAEIVSFANATSVELDTGEQIDADAVIFATGWQQQVDFLSSSLRSHVQRDGAFHLYRHILPPDEPHLGFVGYAQSFMSALTSEMAAHWLSQHFRGELDLPSQQEMEREIARVRQWAEDVFPPAEGGYFIGPFIAHYLDDLMRDMGLRTVRTSNWLVEYFGRLLPRHYRGVPKERRRARSASSATEQNDEGG